ncbi:hypothetical protein BDP67DRAFT_146428 [Colletotrichum lupini]|nr:hypothetical protein BDP67DRAFT_146428 [Colletotrichum lupini]
MLDKKLLKSPPTPTPSLSVSIPLSCRRGIVALSIHPPSQRDSSKKPQDHVRVKVCFSQKHLIPEAFCRPRKQIQKKIRWLFWVNRPYAPSSESRPRRLHVIRIAPRIPPIFPASNPHPFSYAGVALHTTHHQVCNHHHQQHLHHREGRREPLVVHIIRKKRPFANRAREGRSPAISTTRASENDRPPPSSLQCTCIHAVAI